MAPAAKRQRTTGDDNRVACKYGSKCYRKNPEHLKRFKHDEGFSKQKDASGRRTSSEAIKKPETGKAESSAWATQQDSSKIQTEAESGSKGLPPDQEIPASPVDVKESLEQKFLVKMPDDFYDFWQFCETLDKHSPQDALYETLGLRLVGPFDVLSGKLTSKSVKSADDFLCHWRYYYDPPEMQTILRGDDERMYHLGYFRDDPKELPVFVASNAAKDGCKINRVAGNLFAAACKEITAALKTTPDERKKSRLKKLNGALIEFAEVKRHAVDEGTKKRPKTMAATFHGAGIVVPYDSKTEVGYRPLPVSNAKLKAILTKISSSPTDEARADNMVELQEIITNMHLANDECDYGMGLELGLDLFCFGCPKLHPVLLHVLTLAYKLLDREEFAKILTAHLGRRKKGVELSVTDAS